MTRYMIYPYTQNSKGAIDLAKELGGQRILREGSSYQKKPGDVVINWGASDCPYPYALNADNKAVLDKLSFFKRLAGKGLAPRFATSLQGAPDLAYPIFCRTKLQGRDGAGIVVADNAGQLVNCQLYVEGVNKTSEYRVHVGRLPDGSVVVIGAQKKVHGEPHAGQDSRVWTGESTRFVWTVGGAPAVIPGAVTAVSIKAFAFFPELTFGAFDVVYDSDSYKAYVLEINSAPMMTPETAKRYGDFFRKHGEQVSVQPVASAATMVAAPVEMLTVEKVIDKLTHEEISLNTIILGYIQSVS